MKKEQNGEKMILANLHCINFFSIFAKSYNTRFCNHQIKVEK